MVVHTMSLKHGQCGESGHDPALESNSDSMRRFSQAYRKIVTHPVPSSSTISPWPVVEGSPRNR